MVVTSDCRELVLVEGLLAVEDYFLCNDLYCGVMLFIEGLLTGGFLLLEGPLLLGVDDSRYS